MRSSTTSTRSIYPAWSATGWWPDSFSIQRKHQSEPQGPHRITTESMISFASSLRSKKGTNIRKDRILLDFEEESLKCLRGTHRCLSLFLAMSHLPPAVRRHSHPAMAQAYCHQACTGRKWQKLVKMRFGGTTGSRVNASLTAETRLMTFKYSMRRLAFYDRLTWRP